MLRDKYPYYLAGKPVQPNTDLVVANKYTGEPACRVALADAKAIDAAIGAAVAAFEHTRSGTKSWPRHCASRPASRSATLVAR